MAAFFKTPKKEHEFYDQKVKQEQSESKPAPDTPTSDPHGYASKEWAKELIKLVRRRPLLYDEYDKKFKNAEANWECWTEIAEELSVTPTYCRDCWEKLRQRFVLEEKRRDPPSEWFYFKDLLFLRWYPECSRDQRSTASPSWVNDLIRLVRARPLLYDESQEGLKNDEEKWDCWREVARELSATPKHCRDSWEKLRERFVTEEKLRDPPSEWIYFQALSFLRSYTKRLSDRRHTASISWAKELIRLVRARPFLYDEYHKDFSNSEAKWECWTEIAKELIATPIYCRDFWDELRHRFATEEEVREPQSEWIYFKDLLFLRWYPSNSSDQHNTASVSWTRELIKLVRKHRLLFDENDKNFKNAEAKWECWMEIAKELFASPSHCHDSWENLRQRFATEEKLRDPPSDWTHFKDLLFLRW